MLKIDSTGRHLKRVTSPLLATHLNGDPHRLARILGLSETINVAGCQSSTKPDLDAAISLAGLALDCRLLDFALLAPIITFLSLRSDSNISASENRQDITRLSICCAEHPTLPKLAAPMRAAPRTSLRPCIASIVFQIFSIRSSSHSRYPAQPSHNGARMHSLPTTRV